MKVYRVTDEYCYFSFLKTTLLFSCGKDFFLECGKYYLEICFLPFATILDHLLARFGKMFIKSQKNIKALEPWKEFEDRLNAALSNLVKGVPACGKGVATW